ncbi:MAG: hypothetical protein ACYT04_62260, partial [Nostoc sp.]
LKIKPKIKKKLQNKIFEILDAKIASNLDTASISATAVISCVIYNHQWLLPWLKCQFLGVKIDVSEVKKKRLYTTEILQKVRNYFKPYENGVGAKTDMSGV